MTKKNLKIDFAKSDVRLLYPSRLASLKFMPSMNLEWC